MNKLLLFIILLCPSLVLAGGIYKCEDTSGKLSYQSRPCNTDQQRQTVIQQDKNAIQEAPPATAGGPQKDGKASDEKKSDSDKEQEEARKSESRTYEKERFVGTWCFFEQTAFEQTTPEKVTIKLNNDGSYQWSDAGGINQNGTWTLKKNDILNMSGVGNHTILKVTPGLLVVQRFSVMKWRKGGC